ncbi:hypothetical protein [Streptomyces sp. SID13726]|uniref:hypothetical protein n=1 Tax=Streptomyces sp. SID13726 TaxID=2706058 RepID=UPI0013BA50CB|nr:hypothetical protein [Streptomyces sp. SID13726]NEB04522.1 hypothetical protein [Streptomyces sp. SID13726]
MTEVKAEPYEEDPEWDGTVEEGPALAESDSDDVADVPRRRGRAPLTLPSAAARFERAKAAVAKLDALDVEAERAKIQGQMERLTERLAKLDGHESAVKEAAEELAAAETEFNAALTAVQSK